MARLTVDSVSKRFGPTTALEAVGFSVAPGTLTALTGPSGSGKTTLLKIVAGLVPADGGRVTVDPLPTGRPPAVLVFQDNLLFPHLRVLENVTFGPRARRTDKAAADKVALALLDRLGLADKARAWPGELSAGQQQRVALARALAAEPAILLLDEPFANLDRGLRLETARFVRALQRERGLTVLLVTHGQEEAFAVADRVAYLRQGRLIQEGTPEDFRLRPADRETARFTGELNEVTDPTSGRLMAFRAAETRFVPDPAGDAVAVDSEWTGLGFRTLVDWRGARITTWGTEEAPSPGTRGTLSYRTLTFQENT